MSRFDETWGEIGEALARGLIKGATGRAPEAFDPKWDLLKQTQANLRASWKTIRSLRTRLKVAREQVKANREHDRKRLDELMSRTGQLVELEHEVQEFLALLHRDGGHKQDEYPTLIAAMRDAQRLLLEERARASEPQKVALDPIDAFLATVDPNHFVASKAKMVPREPSCPECACILLNGTCTRQACPKYVKPKEGV